MVFASGSGPFVSSPVTLSGDQPGWEWGHWGLEQSGRSRALGRWRQTQHHQRMTATSRARPRANKHCRLRGHVAPTIRLISSLGKARTFGVASKAWLLLGLPRWGWGALPLLARPSRLGGGFRFLQRAQVPLSSRPLCLLSGHILPSPCLPPRASRTPHLRAHPSQKPSWVCLTHSWPPGPRPSSSLSPFSVTALSIFHSRAI